MKSNSFISIIILLIIALSCKKREPEKVAIQFYLPTQEISFKLDTLANFKAAETSERKIVLYTNLDSIAKLNNTDISKIKTITISKMIAFVDAPLNYSFNFLDNALFTLSVPDSTSEAVLAKLENVPTDKGEFDFTPIEKINYLKYAKVNTTQLTIKVKNRVDLPRNYKIRVKIDYIVHSSL